MVELLHNSTNDKWYSFEELTEIIKQDPTSIQALNNLGLLYLSKDMLKDTFICFKKAVSLNQGYSQAYNNPGMVFIKKCRPNKALQFFKKASQLNPEDISALNNLGNVYLEIGEAKEAEDCFRKILEIDPNNETAAKSLNNPGQALKHGSRQVLGPDFL